MSAGNQILEGLRDAVLGNLCRVSFFVDDERQTWVRQDADSSEGLLAAARDCAADAQTWSDACEARISQLETAASKLITLHDCGDRNGEAEGWLEVRKLISK